MCSNATIACISIWFLSSMGRSSRPGVSTIWYRLRREVKWPTCNCLVVNGYEAISGSPEESAAINADFPTFGAPATTIQGSEGSMEGSSRSTSRALLSQFNERPTWSTIDEILPYASRLVACIISMLTIRCNFRTFCLATFIDWSAAH